MSKIIKMTPAFEEECRRDFEKALAQAKLADGKISFTKTFESSEHRTATVYFSLLAWIKMSSLINDFDKEVAWHGVATRGEDETKDEYYITDILVYPQEVTGSTVNTDQAEYEKWLMELDDEKFNNLRMQGHSHVRMSTYPSSVDLTHQEKILDQLDDEMFYIFMIWNKSFDRNIKIYDMKKNILFETKDVTVKLQTEEDLTEFSKKAKEIVRDRKYTPTTYGYYKDGVWHPGSEVKPEGQTSEGKKTASKAGKKETYVSDGYKYSDRKDSKAGHKYYSEERSTGFLYERDYDADDDPYGPFSAWGK